MNDARPGRQRRRTWTPALRCAVFLAGAAAAAACLGAEAPAAAQRITLGGSAGTDRFDGIGVVDGGGATSVLLKDYPEPQRSQILDLVYKPQFGASVSALYVEIPGDGNSTQGSMPSHMHARDDLDYTRGYTWWVMREAARRNPALSLDGAAWSAPGWIGEQGSLYPQSTGSDYKGDARFFSDDTANYYVTWLRGLRQVYGLEMTALGMRNEKGASYDFAKALRKTLDANGFAKVRLHGFDNWPDAWKFKFVPDMQQDPALRDALDVIGAHVNAPTSVVPDAVRRQAAAMGKPIWNTEQHVYKAGFDGLISLVQAFNDNYIESGATKIVNWYGIAGLYTMESYSGEKEAMLRANWPWSGHYAVNPILWGYAHYGQFTAIGWDYLRAGSGKLDGGGSFVTLRAPAADKARDYSVIIETKGAPGPQQVQFSLDAGLSGADLAVWRSDAHAQFVRQGDLRPDGGKFALTLDPDAVYSLTTTRGQKKGEFADVPAVSAFPFPYRETFDGYGDARAWGHLPRYLADIAGAFELAACPGRAGQCLHQAAPQRTLSWGPDWQPYTILGDETWGDYQVAADVYLNAGESAALMGRVNDVGSGYGIIPKGYLLQLDDSGELRLSVVRGKVDKKKLVGDAEQQALIKARNAAGGEAGAGGEKLLATLRLPAVQAGQWHRLALQFAGERITGLVDGKPVLGATDPLYAHGMAGLMTGAAGKRLGMAYFDNLVINRIDGPLPVPSAALPGQEPMYPAGAAPTTRR